MLTRRKILLAAPALILSRPASGMFHRSAGNAYASVDGSLTAPVGGSFQRTNFFTSYALQNMQSYVTRPPWQVAGVDYPVGIPSSVTLKDPSTASLPSGVTYNATATGYGYSTPVVVVTGNNVTVDSL